LIGLVPLRRGTELTLNPDGDQERLGTGGKRKRHRPGQPNLVEGCKTTRTPDPFSIAINFVDVPNRTHRDGELAAVCSGRKANPPTKPGDADKRSPGPRGQLRFRPGAIVEIGQGVARIVRIHHLPFATQVDPQRVLRRGRDDGRQKEDPEP
jgi:hypothetical protein